MTLCLVAAHGKRADLFRADLFRAGPFMDTTVREVGVRIRNGGY